MSHEIQRSVTENSSEDFQFQQAARSSKQRRVVQQDSGTVTRTILVLAMFGGVGLFSLSIFSALLFPALSNAQSDQRRTSCTNNIRNVGLAIASYEIARRLYPGYRDKLSINTTLPVGGLMTNKVPVNWAILILPNLERPDVYRAWKNMTAVDVPAEGRITYKFADTSGNEAFPFDYLDTLVCPDDPQAIAQPLVQPLSYVVNSGLQDVPATGTYPGDWPENGVFVSRWEMTQHAASPQLLMAFSSADSVMRGDGVGSTVMLSENMEARSYGDVFRKVGAVDERGSMKSPVSEQMTSFVWFPENPLPADRSQMQINGLPKNKSGGGIKNPSIGTAADITYARPSSNHPGGANFVFCDSHTRFISDKIDYLVYTLLLTSDGQKARQPGVANPIDKAFTETPVDESAIK